MLILVNQGIRTVLKRGREARYGKKRTTSQVFKSSSSSSLLLLSASPSQGGVYTGVPTDEPDREAFSEGEQEVDSLLKEPEKPKVARGGRQDDSVEK